MSQNQPSIQSVVAASYGLTGSSIPVETFTPVPPSASIGPQSFDAYLVVGIIRIESVAYLMIVTERYNFFSVHRNANGLLGRLRVRLKGNGFIASNPYGSCRSNPILFGTPQKPKTSLLTLP